MNLWMQARCADRQLRSMAAAAAVLIPFSIAAATVPPAEKLLPQSTVGFVSVPEFSQLARMYAASSPGQLLMDPAMQPFTAGMAARWNQDYAQPLEKALGFKFADCEELAKGQVTLAVIDTQTDQNHPSWGFIALVDTLDKKGQLEKKLASLGKKWRYSGRVVRTETLQGVEFRTLSFRDDQLPAIARRLFPAKSQPRSDSPAQAAKDVELLLGRVDSLFVIGSSREAIENVLLRLHARGGSALADLPSFQAQTPAAFRESQMFGWARLKPIIAGLGGDGKGDGGGDEPLQIQPRKLLHATGISEIKALAFCIQSVGADAVLQLFMHVPQTNRHGLVRVIAGEAKEIDIPGFIPSDAVKFKRWRIDGQKTWDTIEKTLGELSPQFSSAMNFVLESANLYASQKQPGFDVRKNLLGNIGDDLIVYRKAAARSKSTPVSSSPSLVLIGSPNPEELAGSLGSILVFLSQQASTPPQEREFLGRKIFSLPLGSSAVSSLGLGNDSGPTPTLYYAPSSGYVGLATDAGVLEEYLRTCQNQTNALKDVAGVADAIRKITSAGSTLIAYENQAETMRARFQSHQGQTGITNATAARVATLLPATAAVLAPVSSVGDMANPSLLPPYEKIAKYLSFTVYGVGADADGFTLKLLVPGSRR